jgi:hypothetical protein
MMFEKVIFETHGYRRASCHRTDFSWKYNMFAYSTNSKIGAENGLFLNSGRQLAWQVEIRRP